ncbi:hypothetical protein C5167_049628 [Papaver somniferum]|uniref:Myb/SANT-like domain-containing protein n=1 Tax=Papaver somniferum TaxID=3469 RepID=A0A4Y7KQH8_PAPSO|nr:glutathione S-transferase T3-like [Papaver somniferum]RZC74145.1 hypothetical protein C5167_049628 [Papaver somniferum]
MAGFSNEEDVALIRAYCGVARESIIDININATSFWQRILGHFRSEINNENARNIKPIQCRVTMLKKHVKRYVGFVKQSIRGMADGGYDVATAYQLGKNAYEAEGRLWTHGTVYEIFKNTFADEYDTAEIPPPFLGNLNGEEA